MRIIKTIEEMQQLAIEYQKSGKTLGFVPTMGYLHEGHAALMNKARKMSDVLITSIFVNPLQFGPNEDFDKYPRDEQRDIDTATEQGVDILFMPSVKEMYPAEKSIQIDILDRVDVLCGKSRPGHFSGVATVLIKLFNITLPDHVFFGKKDAQQVAVVDQLIKELNFPINLHMVETVREADGLAKSSRNVYLSQQERKEAIQLYKGLQIARQKIFDGEKNPAIIVNEVKNYIETHTTGKIDYIEILHFPSLQPIDFINQQIIVAIAVHFEQARLIDNIIISSDGK